MSMHDEFDDDRSVMYIGPRAFVAAFGALCLTLLGVTYGAARISESMGDGAPSPLTALLPWTASPLIATPGRVVVLQSPGPRVAASAMPASAARRAPSAAPPRSMAAAEPQATPAPVHRAVSAPRPAVAPIPRKATAAPETRAPQHAAPPPSPERPTLRRAPAAAKTQAARPQSAGLLVTFGSSAAPLTSAALAPHAADASMMIPNAASGLQPRPAVTAPTPTR